MLLDADFYDFNELWESNTSDCDLVDHVERMETYCPIVENISMDDETLCKAVEKIEYE